jgi:hypothetical protein
MSGAVFEGIFSRNAGLFQFFEAKKETGKSVFPIGITGENRGSRRPIPLPVCENANRYRTFRGMVNGPHSSPKTAFGAPFGPCGKTKIRNSEN